MDEGTRAADKLGGGSERTPEEIRAEIEHTREELGDTVESLAEKADVKKRAKKRVASAKAQAAEKKDEVLEQAKAASPDSASEGAHGLARAADRNRLPLAAGGAFLAGLLVGRLTAR